MGLSRHSIGPHKGKPGEHGVDFLETMARGIGRFRRDVFPQRRAQFEHLADHQHPKALFLTCADSRVLPSMITQTGPGELFVERNPGNIAPIYNSDVAVGVSASIEYAITALKTPHVIICGHSDCGAIKGIRHPDAVANMPAVARWLSFGDEARQRLGADEPGADEEERLRRLTELNVLVQMEHLATHPAVKQALIEGRLAIHGWVYDIETGEVRAFDRARGIFVPFPEM